MMKNKHNIHSLSSDRPYGEESPVYSMVQTMVENFEAGLVSDDKSNIALSSFTDALDWCEAVLLCSPSASVMLEEFYNEGWEFTLADLGEVNFAIEEQRLVSLNNYGFEGAALFASHYFRHNVLVSMVQALRDVWQDKRLEGAELEYKAEDLMMVERVRSADLDVMSVLVGWELRQDGHPEIWRHLIGGEEGDIALAFSHTMERGTVRVSDGETFAKEALVAAFRQWFAQDERVNVSDRAALDYIDGLIESCPAGEQALGGAALSPARLEILSCLPNKRAYLRGMGDEILRDPSFAGLRDEINQSHLLHIAYDLNVTYRGGVPFRNAELASKIFPEMSGSVH